MRFLVMVLLPFLQAAAQTDGTITGRVFLPDGSPAVKVRVSAQSVEDNRAPEALVSITATDNEGRYRLQAPPGRYVIVGGRLDASTYFPGLQVRAEASVLSLGSSQRIEDIDFRVLVPTSRLAGTPRACFDDALCEIAGQVIVVGSGPVPQNVEFRYHVGGCSFACQSVTASAPVHPDGSFIIKLTNRYIVWEGWGAAPESALPQSAACPGFNPPGRDPALVQGSSDLLSYRAARCLGHELQVTYRTSGHVIRGRVTGGDGAALIGRGIRLTGTTDVPGTHPSTVHAVSTIGADGQFSFSNVVRGAYGLSFSAISGERSTAVVVTDSNVEGIEVPSFPQAGR